MKRNRLFKARRQYHQHVKARKAVGGDAYPRLRYLGTHNRNRGYYASDLFYDKKTGGQRFSLEYYMWEQGPGKWEILIEGTEHSAELDPKYGDDVIGQVKERLRVKSAQEGEKKLLQWIQQFKRRERVTT